MSTHTFDGASRTGPIGRLARLLLAATAAASLVSITDQGGLVAFHDRSLLSEPGLLLIAVIMVIVLASLVGAVAGQLDDAAAARRWRRATLGVLAAAAAIAIAAGAATGAAPWRSPLIDLVWMFDALMLTETVVAALLAGALGTPGCEVGVWPELIARVQARRTTPVTGVACIIGLDVLDRWEARRRRKGVAAPPDPGRSGRDP